MKNKIFLLLDDYAGVISETTAINQYLNHHYVVGYNDVAEVLEEVALQEMRHYEKLAEALQEAGINPLLYNSEKVFWRGNYINYQYKVCDILRADIIAELEAIKQYYQHIMAIPDSDIQNMLQGIIRDEVRHIEMFTEKLIKHCNESDNHAWLKKNLDQYALTNKEKEQILNILEGR